jgi:Carboxypeptidase regulatory-like domain
MRHGRRLFWLAIFLFVMNGLVFAQDKDKKEKEAQLRSVRGMVTDKQDKAIHNGTVFLKNTRTNTVISHFTDDEGTYKFTGLDPNVDYEVFAEFNGERSNSRTVSPLDSRKEITLNLKVDKKK